MSSPTLAQAAAMVAAMTADTTLKNASAVSARTAVQMCRIAPAKLRTMKMLGAVGSQITIKSERQTSMDHRRDNDIEKLYEFLKIQREKLAPPPTPATVQAVYGWYGANWATPIPAAGLRTWEPTAEDIIFLKVQRISAD